MAAYLVLLIKTLSVEHKTLLVDQHMSIIMHYYNPSYNFLFEWSKFTMLQFELQTSTLNATLRMALNKFLDLPGKDCYFTFPKKLA